MKGLALVLFIAAAACSPANAPASGQASPAFHAVAGGCAGTVVTDAVPPKWAQSGWSHTSGTPWPVPWSMGTGGGSLAYVFAGQLVAGQSPRVDGSNNKVLWVLRDHVSTFTVTGRPLGQSLPVLSVEAGPSIVDAPSAGCWTFTLAWNANGRHASTINLEVLPKGSVPPMIAGS